MRVTPQPRGRVLVRTSVFLPKSELGTSPTRGARDALACEARSCAFRPFLPAEGPRPRAPRVCLSQQSPAGREDAAAPDLPPDVQGDRDPKEHLTPQGGGGFLNLISAASDLNLT